MKTLAVTWRWVSIDLVSGGLESERTPDSTLSEHLNIAAQRALSVCISVRLYVTDRKKQHLQNSLLIIYYGVKVQSLKV